MAGMTTTRYPQELKERAVRMVVEMEDAPSEWGAMRRVAEASRRWYFGDGAEVGAPGKTGFFSCWRWRPGVGGVETAHAGERSVEAS